MKLWHLAGAVFVILLLADLVHGTIRSASQPPEAPPAAPAREAAPAAMGGQAASALPLTPEQVADTWGPPDAPVALQAYLPRGNRTGEKVVQGFRAVTAAYPRTVRAEVVDMARPGVPEAMVLRGFRVPFVAVNGKTSFTVLLHGRPQEISLADVRRLKSLPLESVLLQIVRSELKKK